jgi:CheY-like chemotaxis protein/HPt (histidine-containing phosphotransfer) domain-containing protein
LSIGRRLATLMNGSLTIESELGKGTAVSLTLSLPIADAGLLPQPDARAERDILGTTLDARRKAPSSEEAEKEGSLVLVVDDHPINRMLLMRQVTVIGYAGEAANDGRQALEMWKTGRFSLVITDVNMPEMDGYELTRAIRAVEMQTGQKRTLVIACTANALKGEADKCFASGMDDYIAKPVELNTLLAKFDVWLPIRPETDDAGSATGQASREAEGENPLIDRSILGEISGDDPDLEREIFAQFTAVNDEDVASLSRALETRDMTAICHLAHRIKGSSGAIGALALAAVSARLESAARAKDWTSIAANQDTFRREAGRLDGYLKTLAGDVDMKEKES